MWPWIEVTEVSNTRVLCFLLSWLFCRDGGLVNSEGKDIGPLGNTLFPYLFPLPLAWHCWTKCSNHSVLFYSVLWSQLNRKWTLLMVERAWPHRLPACIRLCLGLTELWELIGAPGKWSLIDLWAGCEDQITEWAKSFGVHYEGKGMDTRKTVGLRVRQIMCPMFACFKCDFGRVTNLLGVWLPYL